MLLPDLLLSHSFAVERLKKEEIQRAVKAALEEDVGSGDATTIATVAPDGKAVAEMRPREEIVVAGLDFALETFRQLSPALKIESRMVDGERAPKNSVMLTVSGAAQPILTAERVALNFVQRLSGIATITARYVKKVDGTATKILDTRKTTPGWRRFEKYAVACGGGTNHRFGLHDMILIKDNHLAILGRAGSGAIAQAVQAARKRFPKLKVEVEADTLEQVKESLHAGADIILLDNMSLEDLRRARTLVDGKAKTEASGGVTLETVRGIAETGVDFISVGALTHSARGVDIGLDFRPDVH